MYTIGRCCRLFIGFALKMLYTPMAVGVCSTVLAHDPIPCCTASPLDVLSNTRAPIQSASTGTRTGIPEEQCEHAQAPPAARQAGLTKQAFCDDFSRDTLARGATPESRDLVAGKKWTTERATRFGALVMNPASDFSWNADGTLSFMPSANQYQWAISSTVLRNGVLKGYFVDKKRKGFYAEIRWRMDKRGGGQPAFWSMDTCHLYGSPESCAARSPAFTFLEPDFWEYYEAVTSLHYYSQHERGASSIKRCNGTHNNAEFYVRDGEWFVAGSLVAAGQQSYYKDNRRMDVVWNSSTCPGVAFGQLAQGQFPLLIGSKMDEMTVDYVRVWEHPDD